MCQRKRQVFVLDDGVRRQLQAAGRKAPEGPHPAAVQHVGYRLGGSPAAAIIVGAGKLGRALLEYGGFSEYGTNILAAFDLNIPPAGGVPGQKPVLPMSELADFCAAHRVSIGIVTVPKEAAQAVTDVLYRSGVRAFWCFAPCRLQLPPDAVIQYENLALSLAHLKARLA